LRLPPGLTEQDVIEAVDRCLRVLAPTHAFAHYTAEDPHRDRAAADQDPEAGVDEADMLRHVTGRLTAGEKFVALLLKAGVSVARREKHALEGRVRELLAEKGVEVAPLEAASHPLSPPAHGHGRRYFSTKKSTCHKGKGDNN
jgi:hypothetical protein